MVVSILRGKTARAAVEHRYSYHSVVSLCFGLPLGWGALRLKLWVTHNSLVSFTPATGGVTISDLDVRAMLTLSRVQSASTIGRAWCKQQRKD